MSYVVNGEGVKALRKAVIGVSLILVIFIAVIVYKLTGENEHKQNIQSEEALKQAYLHLEDAKGLEYYTTGNRRSQVKSENVNSDTDYKINIRSQVGYSPYIMHVVTKNDAFGKEEFYLDQNAIYVRFPGGLQWEKVLTEESQKGKIDPSDPKAILHSLRSMTQEMKVKRDKGLYILELNLSGDRTKKYIREVWEGQKDMALMSVAPMGSMGMMPPEWVLDVPTLEEEPEEMTQMFQQWMNSIQVKSIKQSIRLDAETLKPIRMDQHIVTEMKTDDIRVSSDLHLKTDIREEAGDIFIPEKVKKTAKVIP
ncbi:DUF6612 family protein [Melghirimyces algeriensis]|uniref:Uncharacterized protein n=1 Tax=Melghirimyces algeriensis TaxID=910412 RepID=A0A521E2I7_9BACL|nr:DUF6612 family protein [Melghirimyces algeriensis]SMO78187.1 hypothetical protein SAMN06264849_107154 [Melghirimyces algeriensis]